MRTSHTGSLTLDSSLQSCEDISVVEAPLRGTSCGT